MNAGKALGSAGTTVAALVLASIALPHQLPLGTLLYGVVYGSLSGLLAIGLVVTYRVTRTINFAYGAMGGAAASAGVSAYLGHGWPWLLAIALSVVLGAAFGALVGALVTWRFSRSPRLVVTVATIGLAQLFGGVALLMPRWVGGPEQLFGGFKTSLSSLSLSLSPVLFTGNDLLVVLLVPATVAAVAWLLLRTDAGRAVRAIADNEDRVRLLGVPARTLLLGTWAVCGAVAGLTAILQAPTQGVSLNAAAGPALLLGPLAAAVIARMESVGTAFVASVALGVLQSVVGLNADKQSIQTLVLLVVVVVALLVQPRATSRADAAEDSSWSTAGLAAPVPAAVRGLVEFRVARVALPLLALGAALLLPRLVRPDQLNQASSAIVFGLAALSLVVLTGWGGTVSLAQMALVGVGAVVAGDLMMHLNLDLFQALAASGVAGGLVALALGVPALRVRGQYLAVTTLAFAVAAEDFFFNPTNFARQLPTSVARPVLWKRFELADERWLYYVSLSVLVLTVALISASRRARPGRTLLAARDNVRGAEAAAVPTTRVKLTSFVTSGVIAGVAGGLNVVNFGSVSFGAFPAAASLLVFSTAVIGGLGSLGGVLASTVVVQWLGIAFPTWQVLLTGVGVVVILGLFPSGLAGIGLRVRDRAVRWLADLHDLDTSVWATGRDTVTDDGTPATAAPTVADPVLSCRGIEASYGSLQVLFGVDLEVGRGEIVALLGTNGAGKSSVLRCLAGLMRTSSGEISLRDETGRGWSPEHMAREGLALVPGGRGVFPTLTVSENLGVARWLVRRDPDREDEIRDRIDELFPALADRWDVRAGDLSGGEQQMLSIAMALLSAPEILCIDELSLGLAPAMVTKLIDAVKQINAGGVTVVIVEQSINTACAVAERAVFLEKGRVRFTGPTEELRERPDLLRAVFLPDPEEVERPGRRRTRSAEEPTVVLACEGIGKHFGGIVAVDGLDLKVHAGEIVGLVGHNGAGKTTLFDLMSGFLAPDSGTFRLEGLDLTAYPANVRALAGLGRSFQEARLFPALTVRETILVAMERHLASRDPVAASMGLPASTDSEAVALAEVDRIIGLVGLEDYRDKLTSYLSTGTRRVVELACVLAQRPSVLLLDEPSGGVAQAESPALVALLRRVAAETGCSIVIIEHDMGMMAELCDRLVALESGRVIAEGTAAEIFSHPEVIASYLGSSPEVAEPVAQPSSGRALQQTAVLTRVGPTPASPPGLRP